MEERQPPFFRRRVFNTPIWLLTSMIAIVAGAAAFAIWWLAGPRIWTDGQAIHVADSQATVRQVMWTPPAELAGPLASKDQTYEPCASPDGSELYFVRGKPGSAARVFFSRSQNGQWTKPTSLDAINGPSGSDFDTLGPRLTSDGQFLLFYSNRPGGFGGYDLWAAQRQAGGWSAPFNLGPQINSEFDEYNPNPSPDGKFLVFATNRAAESRTHSQGWRATIRENPSNDFDLWIARLLPPPSTSPSATTAPTQPLAALSFRDAAPIAGLNSPYTEGGSCFSPAGDFLYFASNRPGGFGKFDIYRSRVQYGLDATGLGAACAFGAPENLGPSINTAEDETDPAPAMGGYRLYFSSDRLADNTRYALFTSDSREVYAERLARPLPALGISVWLLLVSAVVLAFLLPLAIWRYRTGRRLSVLQTCLLLSILVHVLVTLVLSFVVVTQKIVQYAHKQSQKEILVALNAPVDVQVADAIRSQIHDGLPAVAGPQAFTSAMATTPRAIDPPNEARLPAPELPAAPSQRVDLQPSAAAVRFTPPMEQPPVAPPAQSPQPAQARLDVNVAMPTIKNVQAAEPSAQVKPPEIVHSQYQSPVQPPPEMPLSADVKSPPSKIAAPDISVSAPPRVAAAVMPPRSNSPAPAPQLSPSAIAAPSIDASLPQAPKLATAEKPPSAAPPDLPVASPQATAEAHAAANVPLIAAQAPPTAANGLTPVAAAPVSPHAAPVEVADAMTPQPSAFTPVSPELHVAVATPPTISGNQSSTTLPAITDSQITQARQSMTPTTTQPIASLPDMMHTPAVQSAAPGSMAIAAAPPRIATEISNSPAPTAAIAPTPIDLPTVDLPTAPRVAAAPPSTLPSVAANLNDPNLAAASHPQGHLNSPAADPQGAFGSAGLSPSAPPRQQASPTAKPSLPVAAGPKSSAAAIGSDSTQVASAKVTVTPLDGDLGPTGLQVAQTQTPFMRSPEQRKPLLEELGGTHESEDAVDRALTYLARNQEPDGHWTRIMNAGISIGAPPVETVARKNAAAHDMACTGLSLLAFLARDHTPAKAGPYRDVCAKAVDFLLASQGPDGDLRGTQALRGGSSSAANMYDHAIATLALSETALMTHDPRCAEAAIKGAQFILRAQDPTTGGWRYGPGEAGDTSVFGWQIMALHSVQQLGFELPAETRQRALHYIELVSSGPNKSLGTYRPGGGPTPTMTAELLFARMLLRDNIDAAAQEEATKFLTHADFARADVYYWYYASLCLIQMRGEPWKEWNVKVRDTLVHLQSQTDAKDPACGSWDTHLHWGDRAGRVFTTAVATLTLEVYYRYLPLRAPTTAPAAPR